MRMKRASDSSIVLCLTKLNKYENVKRIISPVVSLFGNVTSIVFFISVVTCQDCLFNILSVKTFIFKIKQSGRL